MEIWDVYDYDRKPINKTHVRGTPMKRGEYHVVVEIWIFNPSGHILVTLRDLTKEVYPGFWENTAGSVLTGETSIQGALRELYEETGIQANEKELVYLDTIRRDSDFMDSYALQKDIAIENLTMQAGETIGAKWVSPMAFEEMIKDGAVAEPAVESYRSHYNKFRSLGYLN